MALHHNTVTVGTTPTLLCTIPDKTDYTAVLLYNSDNSAVYLGDATVSINGVNQGIQVPRSTTSTQIWLHAGDSLYAISSTGTTANAISVLYSAVF